MATGRRVLKRWGLRAGQWLLTGLVTWFIVSRVGLGVEELRALETRTWRPHPGPFVASVVVLALGYFTSAGIWGRVVRDLGGPSLSTHRAISIFMVANLGRYVPGKVWQIAGLAALSRNAGVPVATATAAAVAGQGVALIAAGLLGTITFIGGPPPYATWGTVALVVLLGLLLLASIPRVYATVLGAWFRLARTEEPRALPRAQVLRWLALYLLNWLIYAAAFWLLTMSFGLRGSPVAVGSSFAAAYVLGYVMVFAPAGLGPREGFLIAFLTPQFGGGAAGMIAIVARLWTTLVEVVPAAVLWMIGRTGRPERDE
ncbi:MAG: lysylphosphatidylglycerol synthase domain-containing protein [Gemmatimonadota bacterium]|nr:lysylphosphatidylglycerol synthase domain-containing protein [Gemmatimonadota bacterium]